MTNVVKKYKTLKKATEAVNFDVELPKRYTPKEIYVINKEVLEIRFASIIARKYKGNSNIEVYCDIYPKNSYKNEFEVEGVKGIEYWNGSSKSPKCYLAIWDDLEHKYSYSVYSKSGIKLKILQKWFKLFK